MFVSKAVLGAGRELVMFLISVREYITAGFGDNAFLSGINSISRILKLRKFLSSRLVGGDLECLASGVDCCWG